MVDGWKGGTEVGREWLQRKDQAPRISVRFCRRAEDQGNETAIFRCRSDTGTKVSRVAVINSSRTGGGRSGICSPRKGNVMIIDDERLHLLAGGNVQEKEGPSGGRSRERAEGSSVGRGIGWSLGESSL